MLKRHGRKCSFLPLEMEISTKKRLFPPHPNPTLCNPPENFQISRELLKDGRQLQIIGSIEKEEIAGNINICDVEQEVYERRVLPRRVHCF